MISKKILLILICFITLLATVGAYSYTEISRLKNQVDSLNSQRTFTFCWGGPIAEKFNVSIFYLNMTFQRINETHLTVTAKMNDLGQSVCFGMMFDVNHNGELDHNDEGYRYRARPGYLAPDTTTKHYLATPAQLGQYVEDGMRSLTHSAETTIFDLHTCDFDPELGYTYIIPVNLQDVFSGRSYKEVIELISDLIHVEYWGNSQKDGYNLVSVEFAFGKELIA